MRLVLAGESAGSNLVLALAIACCSPRPEPWARALYEAGVVPSAVVPACGILNVCQPRKVRPEVPAFVRRVLSQVPATYVDFSASYRDGELDLADPLHMLEGPLRFTRPLPGFFLPVGTRDPLLDDTRRLAAALARRGVEHQVRYYPGELHAFHFMTWRKAARRCWFETLRFIDAQLRRPLERDIANDNGLQAGE
jgi:acetyl esterase